MCNLYHRSLWTIKYVVRSPSKSTILLSKSEMVTTYRFWRCWLTHLNPLTAWELDTKWSQHPPPFMSSVNHWRIRPIWQNDRSIPHFQTLKKIGFVWVEIFVLHRFLFDQNFITLPLCLAHRWLFYLYFCSIYSLSQQRILMKLLHPSQFWHLNLDNLSREDPHFWSHGKSITLVYCHDAKSSTSFHRLHLWNSNEQSLSSNC